MEKLYHHIKRVMAAALVVAVGLLGIHALVKLELVINVTHSSRNMLFQVFYDTGSGFSEKKSVTRRVDADDLPLDLSFVLPTRKLHRLRIDPLVGAGELHIRSIRLRSIFSHFRFDAEAIKSRFDPAHRVGGLDLDAQGLTVVTTGRDPQIVVDLQQLEALEPLRRETRLVRMILALLPVLLGAWTLLSSHTLAFLERLRISVDTQGRQTFRSLGHTVGVACLVGAGGLALSMALVSDFNTHPDEKLHYAAAEYHFDRWLPPRLDAPEARFTFIASPWGVSYLSRLDIVYLLAGKFTRWIDPLVGKSYLTLRLFNVGLLFMLAGIAVFCRANAYFLILLVTPQLWYVFSYFNGDAFPLLLSLVLGYLLSTEDSPTQRFLFSPNPQRVFSGGLLAGLLLGMLAVSKRNYLITLLYLLVFMAWQLRCAGGEQRGRLVRRYAVILLVGSAVFTVRLAYDLVVNGPDKNTKIRALAERYAQPMLKPSAIEREGSYDGYRLKRKGVSYEDLFSKRRWHETTFESFFGVYGYMQTFAEKPYYRMMWLLSLATLLYGVWVWCFNLDATERVFGLITFLFIPGAVLAASLFSWTYAFQPQGRYLFPVVPIIAMWLNRNGERLSPLVVATIVGAFFLLSLYSFFIIGIGSYLG
jgi:hypothetical protein